MFSRGKKFVKLALEKNRDSIIEPCSSNQPNVDQNNNKITTDDKFESSDVHDQDKNREDSFESSVDLDFDDDVLDPDYKLPKKRKRRRGDSFLKCNEKLSSSEDSTTDDEDDVLIPNAMIMPPNEIMCNSVRESVCTSSEMQKSEMNQMEQNEVSIEVEIDHEEVVSDNVAGPAHVRNKITDATKGNKRKNKLYRERGLAYKGQKRDNKGHHRLSEDRRERILKQKQCSKLCMKLKKPRICRNVSELDRQRIFSKFWYEMTWEEKKVYVLSLVEQGEKKSATSPDQGRRKFSYRYYLRIGIIREEVCRKMFLSTLGLTDKMVYDWVSNSEGGLPKSKPRRKVSAREIHCNEAREHAKEYLNELPKVPSHYCRANSSKKYLEPVFNSIADLHREYIRKIQVESKPSVNYNIFKKIFKDMKLSLYHPKKDMCDLCTGYKAGTVNDEEYSAHITKKTEAQNSKATDKAIAKTNSKVKVVTIDLQSLLLCPQLNASCLYYKTKLSCHNYTVFDLVTKNVICYFWNETDGDLSSNIFASCLINYLESLDLTDVETIVIYSDGCGYQNRNITLSNALLKFSMDKNVTIEQKYLERGHTYMECDSAHSVIEHQIRNKHIYVPQQFVDNIEAACQVNPYVVKYVHFTFFKDYSKLDKYVSIRPGIGVGSTTVNDIRQLRYDPNGIIYYKTGYENCSYEPLPTPRHKSSNVKTPEQLYQMAIPIKKSKYTHLQQIKQVIPKDYHSFYDSLPHHNS